MLMQPDRDSVKEHFSILEIKREKMMDDYTNAAHELANRTLTTGWEVVKIVKKQPGQTGSFFSVCYHVQKGGELCFMKAFDFASFFQISEDSRSGRPIVDIMSTMLDAYRFERDLSKLCQNHHVTKVSFVRDAGEEYITGYAIPVVPYLVFNLADGDIRSMLTFSEDLDQAWKLNSLHDVAVGIKQLHNIEVSHQDLTPSNILIFGRDSRIGDLGRSSCKRLSSPHDDKPFTGKWGYAPPEILYNIYSHDWQTRCFATDCYLFGSLVVFYFSGVTMNALLRKYLPDPVSWEYWRGSNFNEVKDYLLQAFERALEEFTSNIRLPFLRTELEHIVQYLCYPLPEKRGHPRNIKELSNNYSMERFITKFDVLASKVKYELLKGNKSG